jgi:hypothetical protein
VQFQFQFKRIHQTAAAEALGLMLARTHAEYTVFLLAQYDSSSHAANIAFRSEPQLLKNKAKRKV